MNIKRKTLRTVSILAFVGLLFSCDSTPLKDADDYKNKAVQNVKIGDVVEIYYSTNSCCGYCSPSKESLNHLEFVGEKIMIPSPSDCDGCNSTKALLFKAKSVGSDTISGRIYSRGEDCSDTLEDFESFVVHVR